MNSTDGKLKFITACCFTVVGLLISILFGFQYGLADTATLFAYLVTAGLGIFTVWKYIEWKRENVSTF